MSGIIIDGGKSAIDAIANYAGAQLPTDNGTLSSQRIYSKVRIVADCDPDAGTSIFNNTNVVTPQQASGQIRAFGYARGDIASAAGFGTNTTASIAHTNVTTRGEAPNGGSAWVYGFVISADLVKRPKDTSTVNSIADDTDNRTEIVSDAFQDHQAQSYLLDLISQHFSPFVQQGDGQLEYLGKLAWHFDKSTGKFFSFQAIYPEGWRWETHKLISYGLQRTVDTQNIEYVSDQSGPFAFLSQSLDFAVTGGKPPAKSLIAIQDLTVSTLSFRLDPRS
jgi:hypothetical protein